MKSHLISLFFILTLSIGAVAQTTETKDANPADVATVDSILKSLYEVISGEAGQPRDWSRFRSLFHKDARLIPTSAKNPQTGLVTSRALTPDDYVTRVEPIFAKEGFYEIEIARKVDTFGSISQVFSTYESKKTKTDRKPFMRGINSIQLLNDGKRWWIISVYWQQESPENLIPGRYLKK